MKRLLFTLLLLFIVACQPEASSDRRLAQENGPTPVPTAAIVSRPTYIVERGDVVYQLHFTGRVSPVIETDLIFPLSGKINQVYVRRGDGVYAGDLLAEMDPTTDLIIAYRRAEIKVELAQLDLDYALVKSFTPPTTDQQYQIDRLTLLLELAKLELNELQISVGSDFDAASQIIAPFDGEIVSLNISIGQQVAAGDIVGVLADVSHIEITADLRDSQLEELSEKMQVIIEPSGHPGVTLTGILDQLPYPYGSGGGSDVVDVDSVVRISFDDQELAMSQYSLGDLVALTITISERKDVLWLPLAAIREFNGRKFVVVQNGEAQERVDVVLGITGEDRVEILEGVTEGQVIIGP